jgi:hypothetical protein
MISDLSRENVPIQTLCTQINMSPSLGFARIEGRVARVHDGGPKPTNM